MWEAVAARWHDEGYLAFARTIACALLRWLDSESLAGCKHANTDRDVTAERDVEAGVRLHENNITHLWRVVVLPCSIVIKARTVREMKPKNTDEQ